MCIALIIVFSIIGLVAEFFGVQFTIEYFGMDAERELGFILFVVSWLWPLVLLFAVCRFLTRKIACSSAKFLK